LDHICAEQCELVARIGAGQYLREVENLHAFERSGQISLLRTALLKSGLPTESRHCLRQTRSVCARERSDEAIHLSVMPRYGLLRFARNDGSEGGGQFTPRGCRARSLSACRTRRGAAPVLPGSSERRCCSRASRKHPRSSAAATASWCGSL